MQTDFTTLEAQSAQARHTANGDQRVAAPRSGSHHLSATSSADQTLVNLARLLGRQAAREAARDTAIAADHLKNDQ